MDENTKPIEDSQVKSPEYSHSKSYEWNDENLFTLRGSEFALMYNMMVSRKIELITELKSIEILEEKLKEAVESGVAKEKVKKVLKHTITEDDLSTNPELSEKGLKVGDVIEIPVNG